MNIKDIFSDNHLVIQEGQSNCGPAALLNVLHLIEVVKEKSNASLQDIQRSIDKGAYVIILSAATFSGNSHYTVITEYDDQSLYCRDSAYGFLRLDTEYLKKLWHGVDHDASRGSRQWYVAVK